MSHVTLTPVLILLHIRVTEGWIIRLVVAKGRTTDTSLEAEAEGLILPMQQSWIRGHTLVSFEGDIKIFIDVVNGLVVDVSITG